MRCVGQSTTADQHSTIQDSAITRPRVIADSQVGSASAAEAGARLPVPTSPRCWACCSSATAGSSATPHWRALSLPATAEHPLGSPAGGRYDDSEPDRDAEEGGNQGNAHQFVHCSPLPGHHRDLRESLTLPIKPLPNHHRGARPLHLRSILWIT